MLCQKWFYPFKEYYFAVFFPYKMLYPALERFRHLKMTLCRIFSDKMSYAIMSVTTLKNSNKVVLKTNNTSAKVRLHFQCTYTIFTLPFKVL